MSIFIVIVKLVLTVMYRICNNFVRSNLMFSTNKSVLVRSVFKTHKKTYKASCLFRIMTPTQLALILPIKLITLKNNNV